MKKNKRRKKKKKVGEVASLREILIKKRRKGVEVAPGEI